MSKISIVGSEHMGESLPVCLEKFGNVIVPLEESDVCWIAIDTPVDENGHGDIKPIFEEIKKVKPKLKNGVLVIVSSQIPVGTSKKIIKLLGESFKYAYMPEHMKIGEGVSDFMNLEKIVMGIDDESCKSMLTEIFPGKEIVFTRVASGEMIKHATNAFLATSLCFIYDIADMCEVTGADVVDVTKALRLDYRIGKEAYLDASAGFSGGHLERDLDYLQKIAKSKKIDIPVINAVINKNDGRRKMVVDKLGNIKGKKVAFWGTSYKVGVLPSNNSLPAKLIRDLEKKGVHFVTYDPWVKKMNPYDLVEGCVAIICITPWEELKRMDFERISSVMTGPKIFFDARNYFIELESMIRNTGIEYIGVGR